VEAGLGYEPIRRPLLTFIFSFWKGENQMKKVLEVIGGTVVVVTVVGGVFAVGFITGIGLMGVAAETTQEEVDNIFVNACRKAIANKRYSESIVNECNKEKSRDGK
jgi:hypothetical protein